MRQWALWDFFGRVENESDEADQWEVVGGKTMKPRIKQPEPDSRPFWAMPVYSESGIAHLVEPETISDDMPFLADYPANYSSACGMRYVWHELISAGQSGIGAPRCKRCIAAMAKEENTR